MVSNFLGDVNIPKQRSSILSASELISREGIELHKSMNYRDGGRLLSVFLVLPREDGYYDTWDENTEIYTFDGHDSTTVENGKVKDQVGMYGSGRLSDNGKFLKAVRGFVDGIRKEPLQVQIYEKLDPGVFFDKGIFNLMDSEHVKKGERKVFRFVLNPIGGTGASEFDWNERMLSAGDKAAAWERGKGRCEECESERELSFVKIDGAVTLRCGKHGGRKSGGLLG